MKLEIWSDYACPYCYIGKRFLEAAQAEFEHAREVEIVFRAFELDPTSGPAVTTTTLDRIMRKYGKSRSDAQAMIDHITSMGERCGLDMRYASVRYTNTFDAHRLTKFAEQHERGAEMTERLFRAYFTDNFPLADHDVLVGLAQDVGLDGDAVRAMLTSTDFAEDVRRDETRASQAFMACPSLSSTAPTLFQARSQKHNCWPPCASHGRRHAKRHPKTLPPA